MRIQVTNDDGIASEGLRELVRHLNGTDHEIVVVAPDGEWSGAGASISSIPLDLDHEADSEIRSERVTIDGAEDVEAHAVAGSPAYTVIVARLGAFGPPPDLVVSGINAGANTGRAVLHSGTVGAALTAQNFGISGLAVSSVETDDDGRWQWESAAQLALDVLDLVIEAPKRTVINLNVPPVPADRVRGIRWARLAPFGLMRAQLSAGESDSQQFELRRAEEMPPPDTDVAMLDDGYATLTTLAGVTEAWPDDADEVDPSAVETRLVPGADLHPVHRVPDRSRHTLRQIEDANAPGEW